MIEERPQPTQESFDVIQPQIQQELLIQAAEVGISDEKKLFSLILKKHGLKKAEVYQMIFDIYRNYREHYGVGGMNVSQEVMIEESVTGFVRNYVLQLTLPEKPVESKINSIDPDNLMIPLDTLRELKDSDIESYDLSNLEVNGDQLWINTTLLRGIPSIAHLPDDMTMAFSWGRLDELGKIDRDRMMRVFATIWEWEQKNNAKLTQTGEIVR